MSFESEVSDIDEVTKRLKVQIPAERVSEEFESAIKGLMNTAKVKGFRPGKAPRQMIEQQHGSRVQMEVANRLISSTLQEALSKLKIDMVGMPEIDVSNFEPGQKIEYTADISVFPSPSVKGYDKFEVSVQKREVLDKDVDQFIDGVRERTATLRKLEFRNTVQDGDVIDASICIYLDGEEPSGSEPLVVRIGEGLLPADVEKGLIGLEVGETRELSSTIPDNHADEKVRGKKAHYKVTLNTISERVMAEPTDEWAKTLGLNVETMLELRIKVREMLEQEKKRGIDEETQAAVLKQLVERNDFKVPQVIVDDQIRQLLVRMGIVDTKKVDPSRLSMEPFREKLGATALERSRGTILIDKIAEMEGLKATPEEIDKALGEIATGSNVTLAEVKKYFSDSNRMIGLALELTRNKVLEMLAGRAKVNWTDKAAAQEATAG